MPSARASRPFWRTAPSTPSSSTEEPGSRRATPRTKRSTACSRSGSTASASSSGCCRSRRSARRRCCLAPSRAWRGGASSPSSPARRRRWSPGWSAFPFPSSGTWCLCSAADRGRAFYPPRGRGTRNRVMTTRPWVGGVLLASVLAGGCAGFRFGRPGAIDGDQVLPGRTESTADAVAMGEFLKAQVAVQQGDVDVAVSALERAVAADPATPMLRLQLATLYVRQGKIEPARVEVTRVLEVEPDNVEARELLAGLLSALG